MKRDDMEAIGIGDAGLGDNSAKVDKVGRKSLRAPTGPNGNRRPRRSFRPEYKLAVLAEYDRCNDHGQRGALLRREGLYSSLVTDWRRQHREGSLVGSAGRSEGGRGGASKSEVERLRRRIRQLEDQLAKQETIIEVQGKVQELLEEISRSSDKENE
ncbi:MAG: hypothetical protein HKN03_10180 [Acidimicrobiales bacterium]|nr:hypothetical protein [Acidimicrobiales bacterium]